MDLPGRIRRKVTVVLTLVVDDGSYEPGVPYVGVLHVLTPGETLLEVPLRLRATASTVAP